MKSTLSQLILRGTLILLLVSLVVTLAPLATIYAQDDGVTTTVIPAGLTVRAGPGINFADLAVISRNAEFQVEARENLPDNGLWVYGLTADGLYGWVLSDFLAFPSGFVMLDLPVLGTDAPTGSTSDIDAETTEDTADSETETETDTTARSDSSFSRNTPPVAVILTGTTIYAGVGTDYDIIATVPADVKTGVLGRDKSHFWIQVAVNGQIGWVFYGQVELIIATRDLPVIQDNKKAVD